MKTQIKFSLFGGGKKNLTLESKSLLKKTPKLKTTKHNVKKKILNVKKELNRND